MQYLDAHLVEHLHALHRQRETGLLLASTIDTTIGICVVGGEILAVDIGQDLNGAFLEACLVHHKIDQAAQAEALAAAAAGQPARRWLEERQLISAAEGEQMLQAVVEDALMRVLVGPCLQRVFHPGVRPDDMALERTAVRVRIGVEPLIQACARSVAERLVLAVEVGGADAVFALAEGAPPAELSDYEKLVLNFVDGRTSLGQIAVACRDSDANLARVFRALLAKRVVTRVRTGSSLPREAAAAPAAPPPASAAPPARAEDEERRLVQRWVRIGLGALLALVLLVAALVWSYNRKQQRLHRDEAEVAALIETGAWAAAREAVARLRQEAGEDLAALRQVALLEARVEEGIARERQRVAALIEAGAFAEAARALHALPDAGELAERLRQAEREEHAAAEELAQALRARLLAGDIGGALALLDGQDSLRAARAERALAAWRAEMLALAGDEARPLGERAAALAALRQARPDAALAARLDAIEARLAERLEAAAARARRIEARALAGAHAEAAAELRALGWQPAPGLWADEPVRQAAAAIAAVRDELAGACQAGLAAVADPAASPAAAREAIERALRERPQASEREQLERLLAALAACQDPGTDAERAAAAERLAEQHRDDEPLAAALTRRAAAFREREQRAAAVLDTARYHARRAEWAVAQALLDDLLADPQFRDSSVRAAAAAELEAVRRGAQRERQLRTSLAEALHADDAARVQALARELGLELPPLAVHSVPAGAEVWRDDGERLGTTPLVLDLPADARAELQLRLRAPGYREAVLEAARADGGWRLFARLERQPLLEARLPHPLTMPPSVVGGELWLADRARAAVLPAPAPGGWRTIDFPHAVAEPILAPAAPVGEAVAIATRAGLAWLVRGSRVERVPLPAGSDFPPLVHRSEFVLDRELWIVADIEGRLVAGDGGSGAVLWRSEAGAPWAGPPLLAGDGRVLAARADGRLGAWRAEDGRQLSAAALGAPVLAAWAEDGILVGATATEGWRWDGRALQRRPLPGPCIAAGPGALVRDSGEALIADGEDWRSVGRLEQRPGASERLTVRRWGEHAVVQGEGKIEVLGPRPFLQRASHRGLLEPAIWGERLVTATLDGELWVWNP